MADDIILSRLLHKLDLPVTFDNLKRMQMAIDIYEMDKPFAAGRRIRGAGRRVLDASGNWDVV